MKNWLIGISIICLIITGGGNFYRAAAAEPSGSFYVKSGTFIPKIEDINLDYNFGSDGIWFGEGGLNWKLYRTFEMRLSAVFNQYLIPLGFGSRYRFDYTEDQTIVPYIGAELNAYREYKDDALEPITGNPRLWQYGYSYSGGVQILLDYFNQRQAREMDRNWKVQNTYLDFEVKHAVVNNFGKEDLDYGGNFYSFGLLFEF